MPFVPVDISNIKLDDPASAPTASAPAALSAPAGFKPVDINSIKLDPAPQQPSVGDSALRVLGLDTRAALTGLSAPVALPANAVVSGINAVTGSHLQLPSDGFQQTMTAVGLPVPQNTTERLFGDAISGATGGALAGPSGILPGITGNVASGGARELGYGPVAQLAAGVAGGGLTGLAAKAAPEAAASVTDGVGTIKTGMNARTPNQLDDAVQAMKDASTAKYQAAENAGAILTPKAASNVVASLSDVVPEQDTAASQKLYSKTLGAISDLQDDVANGNTSLLTLDRHRQILGNLAKDITNPNRAQEAQAASKAIDAIDQQVNGLGANDLGSGPVNDLRRFGKA